jgi:hypothetical protein
MHGLEPTKTPVIGHGVQKSKFHDQKVMELFPLEITTLTVHRHVFNYLDLTLRPIFLRVINLSFLVGLKCTLHLMDQTKLNTLKRDWSF